MFQYSTAKSVLKCAEPTVAFTMHLVPAYHWVGDVRAHTTTNVWHLECQSVLIKSIYVPVCSFHSIVLLRKVIVVRLVKKFPLPPLPLRKPDIYYFRVHKSPLSVSILHEKRPVHSLFPWDDLKDRRGYYHLKEEALDRTMWRNRFGRGFGPVVRQITE